MHLNTPAESLDECEGCARFTDGFPVVQSPGFPTSADEYLQSRLRGQYAICPQCEWRVDQEIREFGLECWANGLVTRSIGGGNLGWCDMCSHLAWHLIQIHGEYTFITMAISWLFRPLSEGWKQLDDDLFPSHRRAGGNSDSRDVGTTVDSFSPAN